MTHHWGKPNLTAGQKMTSNPKPNTALYGLGTMGAALALNIAEKGFPLAVCNRTNAVVRDFYRSSGEFQSQITPTETLAEMVAATATPRNIILMVPAGPIVDETMKALRPLLDDGDLIIDAGNANFADTNRRAAAAVEASELFLGIGVSGGEEGARHGPSICLLYTSPSPRDKRQSRMPSSA